MSGATARGARRFVGWLAVILFVVFCGNIVVAKLTGLAGPRVTLLSDVAEFLLLHVATMSFVAYALVRESESGAKAVDDDNSVK